MLEIEVWPKVYAIFICLVIRVSVCISLASRMVPSHFFSWALWCCSRSRRGVWKRRILSLWRRVILLSCVTSPCSLLFLVSQEVMNPPIKVCRNCLRHRSVSAFVNIITLADTLRIHEAVIQLRITMDRGFMISACNITKPEKL